MERVRVARVEDLDRCAALVQEAAAAARSMRGGDLLAAHGAHTPKDGVERAALDPAALVATWSGAGHRLVVGEFDGAVVGVGAGTVLGSSPRAVGRVECCYVEPAARGVGVGSALLTALVSWFAGEGCKGVDAVALPGDRLVKQRLEAAGFKARLLVLHRPLD